MAWMAQMGLLKIDQGEFVKLTLKRGGFKIRFYPQLCEILTVILV